MSIKDMIKDIEREIEDTKIDIAWSDDKKTISILEEKLERLETELDELYEKI